MKRAAFLLLTLVLLLPVTTYAAEQQPAKGSAPAPGLENVPVDQLSFPQDFYIRTDIIPMPGQQALFADRDKHRIYMTNLQTNKEQWSKSYDRIYNYKIMPDRSKIVLLVNQQQTLQKIVLSAKGKILSRYRYPQAMLNLLNSETSAQIGWSAPDTSGNREKIALQVGDRISIYQSPWKKPIQTFSSSVRKNSSYKNMVGIRLEYQGNDLVIAYEADSMMQTQHIYELLNTSRTDRQPHLIKTPWNLQAEMQLENGELVIYTTNILGNPLGQNTDTPYPIYARYDVQTGKQLAHVSRTLADQGQKWRSDYSHGQLFLADTSAGKLYLYDSSGKSIWETAEPSRRINYRFIQYEKGILYLLIENENREFTIGKVPVL